MIEKDPFGNIRINFKKIKFKDLRVIFIIAIIILLVWVSTGLYMIDASENGVVKRFGKVVKIVGPGLHYHMPFPIETVDKAEIAKIHRIEVGYRTTVGGRVKEISSESLMLTGDENIVSIDFIVQYKISDIIKYLYEVSNVRKTIKEAAEAVIREVAGKEKIDDILTTGKGRIQIETMRSLQKILDSYNCGVKVVLVQLQDISPPTPVDAAFKDVASAKEDRNRFVNEAKAYRNEVIPKARAKAASIIYQAQAYSSEQVEQAKGETSRFLQIFEEYKKSPLITKRRLYLENVSKFLSKSRNYIFDSNITEIRPLLGLDSIKRKEIGSEK
ncbi:MAG: FtsH protease activity modulator HflK [Deferribacterota bacterium]|nr:FtsH protease activity modulator HflK [Deferribacterota bacterium]